ncbi:Sushi like protein [Argiope bruennichi]|uniref:Sushi like protein n=1 Tax=Argiope bruennichi TaxID=94029 RepID=A0A8T0E8N8_ARGBR|nr:Sushi like protein [Argiope bruennichi]
MSERHIDYLREPKTKCFLSQELQDVVFKDSRATNIAAGLEEARLVFQNARPNVNKVLILVSDGLHTMGGDPFPYAERLKALGVEIFSFGIGRSLQGELEGLASSKDHVYNCDGFRDFDRLAKRIRGDPHESSWSGQAAQPNCDHLCDSPYRGDPIDPGCCDHNARCSCALLSGMHTCVCGPGYYGYSGLAGQCRACPKGTYKSKLEPAKQCTSCPAGSTTTREASTSLKDCVCQEGYEGNPLTGLPCTLKKCPPLQKPTNGFVFGDCENSEKVFGSECHFLCEEGFELVDKENDIRTCLANGSWSGKNSVCRRIHCRKPPKPRFGHIFCDKGDLLVGAKCRFSCFRGFIMEGSPERECLSSQRWSGAEAKCTHDEPPKVVSCPSKIEVTSDDIRQAVFWDEPQFEDNSGRPIRIEPSHKSGHEFGPGRHTVTYHAFDYYNNNNSCVFDVIMTRNTCPFYPCATNGAFSCNDWMFGQVCQAFCNEKYDFVEKPAEWYICNENSVWVTMPENMPVPWPDCSTKEIPGKIRHMMKGFYYCGDCNDPQVQIYIKKVFLHHLSVQFEKADLCVSKGTCNLQTVKVHCGKTTDHLAKNRRRRDVWEHAEKEELELEFEITIDVDQELNDTEAVLQNFLETIQNLKWDMDEDFVLQPTTLAPDLQADSDQWSENQNRSGAVMFTDGETTIECKPGSVLSKNLCVLCSVGTFYEPSARECWDCPLGHYQQKEGQTECHKCPEGMTTEYTRSRNITECKGICLPGTYSPTGLETCLACPIGTYQEHEGQKVCNVCPEGTTTASSQSVSVTDCRDFCGAGSFSISRLQPCEACPKGFYQPLIGQTACLECPANFSTFRVGSTNISDCLDLDPCAGEYCKNYGICTRLGRNAVCLCSEGFIGNRCEMDIDECIQKPCFNDGTCINTVGSFYCNCSEGFSGALCDEEEDECLSFPCMNNGTCIDKEAGSNNSSVIPGWIIGNSCSDVDDCENVTCLNNGRCVDEIASFKCICQDGYMGSLCEIDINECETHQCWAGSTCQDLVGGYVCLCPPGWSGRYCETKLSDDFVLNFPESTATIANMASMTLNSPLSDVTVSMWVQTTDTKRSGTPLSYAVASASTTDGQNTIVDNALTINDCSGVHIYVNKMNPNLAYPRIKFRV